MDKPKTKKYPCPHCKGPVTAHIPKKDQVVRGKGYWDSAKVCPNCFMLHFAKVWPSGKVVTVKLGVRAGKNFSKERTNGK